MQVSGLKILVVGIGVSGQAVARYCAHNGAHVTVNDSRTREELSVALQALSDVNVEIVCREHPAELFLAQDLIIVSPGVPHDITALQKAREAKIKIIGEVEFAYQVCNKNEMQITAITGTNGKSTVTSLVGEIYEASGHSTFVGGNIGTPFIAAIENEPHCDWAVLEVSSFQLETIAEFHPFISVVLNVTPDHLDRYENMDSYALTKRRLVELQNKNDFAILCGLDSYCVQFAQQTKARVVLFFGAPPAERPSGAWAVAYADNESVVFEADGAEAVRIDKSNWQLVGGHNTQNLVAAVSCALISDVPADVIERVISGFTPLDHRCALVGELNGVKYYDDSKGTNVGAVEAALSGFVEPVVLLLGGRDKDGNFSSLKNIAETKARAVIIFGEASEKIAAQLKETSNLHVVSNMKDAMTTARQIAQDGDSVLLSPGCASFDEFSNYAHRGDVFASIVHNWQEKQNGTAGFNHA